MLLLASCHAFTFVLIFSTSGTLPERHCSIKTLTYIALIPASLFAGKIFFEGG